MISLHAMQPAIYAMVVASLLPLGFAIAAKMLGGFKAEDNQHPRLFLAELAQHNPPAYRAHCAQENSWEMLPIFLASVLLALFMVVPMESINKLAWAFILLRIGYGAAYIANLDMLRSCLWVLSLACPLLLFYFCLGIA